MIALFFTTRRGCALCVQVILVPLGLVLGLKALFSRTSTSASIGYVPPPVSTSLISTGSATQLHGDIVLEAARFLPRPL